LYGGRKALSKAFRNRFVELHFEDIPLEELKHIISKRGHIPETYSHKLIALMKELQANRQGGQVFAGKNATITLRDLFRLASRYSHAQESVPHGGTIDHLQVIADDAFMLLAERCRKSEDQVS
jgi:midasin